MIKLGRYVYDGVELDYEFYRVGKKTTICVITKHGYEFVGMSSCVDPAKFNKELGEEWALKDAVDKVYEAMGFYLSVLHDNDKEEN